MAKRKEPKEKAPAVERTRATNPIYQGEYTILDFDRDMERVRSEELSEAEKEEIWARTDEWLDGLTFPPEETARLELIDAEAWERYDGPRTWDGIIKEIPKKRLRRVFPLQYYRYMYEAEDEEAIAVRVKQIYGLAKECETKNRAWADVEAMGKAEKYREALDTSCKLDQEINIRPVEPWETWDFELFLLSDLLYNPDTGLNHTPEELVDSIIQRREHTNDLLREIAREDYDSLGADPEKKAARDCLEKLLPRDRFEAEYDYPRGYEDAITRIYKLPKVREATTRGATPGEFLKHPETLEGVLRWAVDESLKDLNGMRRQPEGKRAEKSEMTTFDMGKAHPSVNPTKYVLGHDRLFKDTGTDAFHGIFEDRFNKGQYGKVTIRNERKTEGKPAVSIKLRYDGREPDVIDMATMNAIASMQREADPASYRDKRFRPAPDLWMSENDLLRYRQALPGYEPTEADREDLYERLRSLSGSILMANMEDYLEDRPEEREVLNRNLPPDETTQEVGTNVLQFYVKTSRNTRPTKIEEADGSIKEEYRKTRYYHFVTYPLPLYFGRVQGQSSLLDSRLLQTPEMLEQGKDAEKVLNRRTVEKLDELSLEGCDLWKRKKDGTRYISLSKVKDLSGMRWAILSNIWSHTADKHSGPRKANALTLDFDKLIKQIWKECAPSTRTDRTRYMITYLVYLMDKPHEESRVYDFKIVRAGKRIQKVIIQLEPPKK